MSPLLSLGLPILLVGFLLYLIWNKTKKVTVKNANQTFKKSMEQAFQNSKYKKFMDYWLAVSKMETGGWTSYLFLKNNNPWGMKYPRQRQNLVSGQSGEGWAIYSNLDNAARDIILWMDAKRFRTDISTLEDFVLEMKANGYFEEPYSHYLNLVKAWINR